MGFEPIFDSEAWARVPFEFWTLVFFVFGCIVGSFLNVCIHRMPLGMSLVTPPSHCPHCKYSIPWYLNVPLLTWLWLRGRCKNCGAPISPRYFLVELLTGVAFLGCWLAFGKTSALLALVYCVFLAGLIVATFIDFEHFIIPDEITLGGAVVGFLCSAFLPALHDEKTLTGGMKASLFGMAAGAGVVYLIVRLGKLLFGRQNIELDPDSRVVFRESDIVLPPKRLALETLVRRSSGFLAFRAQRVELTDRCHRDVMVGISATKIVVGDKTFEPSDAPHVEFIVDAVPSPGETARLVGVSAAPVDLVRDSLREWIRRLLGAVGIRKWPHLACDTHLIFVDGVLWLCRANIPFEDVFYRESDTIRIQATSVETQFGSWKNTPVQMTPIELRIGDAAFNPEAVTRMEVVTDSMVVPREAMGLGDVKFMAAIGAFLGWRAVIFSLMASSIIGSVVGVALIVSGKREWSSRLPYGPYIALAAAVWIFWGRQLLALVYR